MADADDIVSKGQGAVEGATEKAKELFEDVKGKLDSVVNSDKAEEVSDSILDSVADFAKKILPEDTHAKIDEVRGDVDDAIGSEK